MKNCLKTAQGLMASKGIPMPILGKQVLRDGKVWFAL